MRYIPTFRFPVSGFLVNTSGNVMNRPPSCGQHFRIGKSNRLTSLPFWITSLQGPVLTPFGKNDPSSASFGNILTLSKNPCGVSIFKNPWIRSATSSSSFTSNASAIRRTLPNALINSGYRDPFGLSNSSAVFFVPPASSRLFSSSPVLGRHTRCVTSAISRIGSTSARMRFSSPSFSSLFTNSRKSAYATVLSCPAELYHEPRPIPLDVLLACPKPANVSHLTFCDPPPLFLFLSYWTL